MEAYFNGIRRPVTKEMEEVFLGKEHAAVITIDICRRIRTAPALRPEPGRL